MAVATAAFVPKEQICRLFLRGRCEEGDFCLQKHVSSFVPETDYYRDRVTRLEYRRLGYSHLALAVQQLQNAERDSLASADFAKSCYQFGFSAIARDSVHTEQSPPRSLTPPPDLLADGATAGEDLVRMHPGPSHDGPPMAAAPVDQGREGWGWWSFWRSAASPTRQGPGAEVVAGWVAESEAAHRQWIEHRDHWIAAREAFVVDPLREADRMLSSLQNAVQHMMKAQTAWVAAQEKLRASREREDDQGSGVTPERLRQETEAVSAACERFLTMRDTVHDAEARFDREFGEDMLVRLDDMATAECKHRHSVRQSLYLVLERIGEAPLARTS